RASCCCTTARSPPRRARKCARSRRRWTGAWTRSTSPSVRPTSLERRAYGSPAGSGPAVHGLQWRPHRSRGVMPIRLRLPRTMWFDRSVLAVLIAIAAWLSLTLARGPGELAAIWVGNGLLAGWLLMRRTSSWPGYVLVAYLAELPSRMLAGDAPGYALAIAFVNLLEALLVAGIVRYLVPDTRDPRSWMRLGSIATSATFFACALAGLLAAGIAHALNDQPFVRAFGAWFAAHVVGMTLVATATLVAHREGWGMFVARGRTWSLASTLALLVIVAIGVFANHYSVLFLTYPPLLLVAVRHRFAGVALG